MLHIHSFITLWVDLLGDLQSVRVGQVGVGGRDGQDEAALLGDELQQHVADLVLDVVGLVSDGHFGHPGKIDEGEVQHCGWESEQRRTDCNGQIAQQIQDDAGW